MKKMISIVMVFVGIFGALSASGSFDMSFREGMQGAGQKVLFFPHPDQIEVREDGLFLEVEGGECQLQTIYVREGQLVAEAALEDLGWDNIMPLVQCSNCGEWYHPQMKHKCK